MYAQQLPTYSQLLPTFIQLFPTYASVFNENISFSNFLILIKPPVRNESACQLDPIPGIAEI